MVAVASEAAPATQAAIPFKAAWNWTLDVQFRIMRSILALPDPRRESTARLCSTALFHRHTHQSRQSRPYKAQGEFPM